MEIEFIASLPDIQTAISIGGDGATRVRLDIPESELANAVKLILLKGQAFRVIISDDPYPVPERNTDPLFSH